MFELAPLLLISNQRYEPTYLFKTLKEYFVFFFNTFVPEERYNDADPDFLPNFMLVTFFMHEKKNCQIGT